MKSNFKITIPEPCNENWDKMTPDETGRFCSVCNKSVIDFTNKLPEEIQHFFLKNQGQRICGRFKSSQLDSVSIQIPSRVLFSQTQYHKMFLLALFVAMGTSLFSCSSVNGKKQKIEKIEVVDQCKTSSLNNIQIKEMRSLEQLKLENEDRQKIIREDSIRRNSLQIPRVYRNSGQTMGPIMPIGFNLFPDNKYEIFSLPKNENKTIFFQTSLPQKKYVQSNYTEEKNIETEPYFPGGITKFYTFFAEEFKMPENTELVNNTVGVVIHEDGSATYYELYPQLDKILEEEIIRVLKLSPKWQPGKSSGIFVSKTFILSMDVI